ncbi:MAG: glycosyl transferase [Verrucomicrobia bacterium GWC2_42_7]|nr:MAG: glycosyl transferase [Verrucomicrobia bacterium GWC2_42_7]
MNSEKLPISVVLIAHNEAHNIRRCLDSIASWVSEIIVVVNDCTDGTDAIARSYGAKIFEHPWHGHRDQKNIAIGYATQSWILQVDADEEVSDELRGSIITFIEENDLLYAGAYFPRKVWFLGQWIKHGDWYPDYSLRLFRRGAGICIGSHEHDTIKLNGKAKKLKGDLHHYTYPSLNAQIPKIAIFGDYYLKRMLEAKTPWNSWAVAFRSLWRFFRAYFLRLGFLDGFPGFYIAFYQGFATLFRHAKLYEHLNKDIHPTL